MIQYYPDLGSQIEELGFTNSTVLFSFLRSSNIKFDYDRITTTFPSGINSYVSELKEVYNNIWTNSERFIFYIQNEDRADVILLSLYDVSLEKLLKYLELKTFC